MCLQGNNLNLCGIRDIDPRYPGTLFCSNVCEDSWNQFMCSSECKLCVNYVIDN